MNYIQLRYNRKKLRKMTRNQRKWAMKISYRKLWILLAEQEISKKELREGAGIAPNTMTKLNQEKEVSLDVLLRICDYLSCNIGDICDAVEG